MTVALLSLTAASLAVALYAATSLARTIPSMPRLVPVHDGSRVWPRVSVIVTARDEARTIEAALRAKLDDGYSDVEYIVVDDRSTDGTGAIIDRLAAADPRVVPLHIEALPNGWLGKVHAMHRATELATGDWLLFSDADVHLAKGTLEATVSHCEKHALDHLAAFPQFWRSSPLLDATISTMLRFLILFGRLWKLSDPKSSASVGSGTFNFVRRSVVEAMGGFDAVRLDVLDDILLGQRVKKAGGRQGAVQAVEFVGLHYYTSLGEMTRAFEKNALALYGYSVPRCVLTTFGLLGVELLPYVAIFSEDPVTRTMGVARVALAFLTALALSAWIKRSVLDAFLHPLGTVLFVLLLARAALVTRWRGEVVWRDTRYRLEELERASRFELPF